LTTFIGVQRGHSLQAVVRDDSDRPLANALFQATSWKGDSWLQQFGYSDTDGKFRWDAAPADEVTFNVSCPGFHNS
jgi:hypothetical protein